MKRILRRRPAALRLAGVVVGLAITSGCDLIGRISGAYTGPLPAQEALTDEIAIVRQVTPLSQGQMVLILDRTRYLTSNDPHDVNRVVKAWTTQENHAAVSALNLAPGDRVQVSTTFSGIDETAGSLGVPDWPGHDAMEYPIGSHRILSIARTAQ